MAVMGAGARPNAKDPGNTALAGPGGVMKAGCYRCKVAVRLRRGVSENRWKVQQAFRKGLPGPRSRLSKEPGRFRAGGSGWAC